MGFNESLLIRLIRSSWALFIIIGSIYKFSYQLGAKLRLCQTILPINLQRTDLSYKICNKSKDFQFSRFRHWIPLMLKILFFCYPMCYIESVQGSILITSKIPFGLLLLSHCVMLIRGVGISQSNNGFLTEFS